MVVVPAGEFLRGSGDDPFAFGSEKPQRSIYLDAFWLDQYEVTNALYAQCVNGGACRKPAQARSHTRQAYYGNAAFTDYPVIYVSWLDAKNFCAWNGKRLPSEAEWEKAARSVDGRRYPWGNEFDANRLNSIESGNNDTVRVGNYPSGASVYGAHDLAGNVWEWVADFYQADYYRIAAAFNPTGPASGPPPSEAIGVMRGGAWNNNFRGVRSAYRLGYFQRHVGFETGIRCAWDGK
jgi:serine/threonine-protein kinase